MKNKKAFAYRFLFRRPGELGWNNMLAAFYPNLKTAESVCERFRKEDFGKREWKIEECYPEDFDYPGKRQKEMEARILGLTPTPGRVG